MTKLTTKELNVLVGNCLAKQITKSRKPLNAVQHAVSVRLSNAMAIEASIAALNAAESR